jgi:hypothetical protein
LSRKRSAPHDPGTPSSRDLCPVLEADLDVTLNTSVFMWVRYVPADNVPGLWFGIFRLQKMINLELGTRVPPV